MMLDWNKVTDEELLIVKWLWNDLWEFTLQKNLNQLLRSGDEFLLQSCLPLIGKMWRKLEHLSIFSLTNLQYWPCRVGTIYVHWMTCCWKILCVFHKPTPFQIKVLTQTENNTCIGRIKLHLLIYQRATSFFQWLSFYIHLESTLMSSVLTFVPNKMLFGTTLTRK